MPGLAFRCHCVEGLDGAGSRGAGWHRHCHSRSGCCRVWLIGEGGQGSAGGGARTGAEAQPERRLGAALDGPGIGWCR